VTQVFWQGMNVEVVGGICESQRHCEIRELLKERNISKENIMKLNVTLTLRDSKETKEYNAIAMCSSDVIVYVTDGEVNRPVLVVSGSYRYGSFITAENDRAKDRAVAFVILRNYVLNKQ
jgi:hypothetical protein